MTILVSNFKAHDLIITMFDYRHCLEAVTLTNDFGASLTSKVGMLTKGTVGSGACTPCDTGDTATGICLTDITALANAGTQDVVILNRGPAVVDSSLLLDAGGDALAGVIADLAAVGISIRAPATLISEGVPVIP